MRDFVITPLSIVAVPLLIYSWWFFVDTVRHESGWQTRVIMVVLVLDTVCLLLLPVAYMTAPPARGDYNASMHAIGDYYEKWHRVVAKIFGVGFLLSFFCKGRLIATLAIASIGLAFLWIGLTTV